MLRWNDANRFALKPAIAEINQTSRLTLTATPHKIGRTVASVTITWVEKLQEAKQEAMRKLDRPKVGRTARRDGTTELPALAFPASGSIEFSKPWKEIAKLNGNGKDLIATDSRNWCQALNIPLDGPTIEKTFKGFCKRAKL